MIPTSAEEALRLARAICPTWVEHRGCVIRENQFDASNFQKWWESTGGARERIELALNHQHLWDLLMNTGEKDYAELWELGELMVVGWRASLRDAFPDREFDVRLSDDYGPTVSARTAEPERP